MTEPAGSDAPPPPRPVSLIITNQLGPCSSQSADFDQHLEAVKSCIDNATPAQITAAEAQAQEEKKAYDEYMAAVVAQAGRKKRKKRKSSNVDSP
ncbi:hypothetical protein DUNSADRAFT_15679 [Dunaliella salina]|uniref:Uncharacterized protein n=1 Tax=Dunaliella salina TaxID=3046 RepID=A0ABQ7G4X1_DUNSA|nr:hypothetical protein DUNSADRAFT_15679 [Dunaliella salina]|eukprot:KAF5829654.1 hypothetical protein DUNSADRAFT_15679 [Dunaliella salina]